MLKKIWGHIRVKETVWKDIVMNNQSIFNQTTPKREILNRHVSIEGNEWNYVTFLFIPALNSIHCLLILLFARVSFSFLDQTRA